MISLRDVRKSYPDGAGRVEVLRGVSLEVKQGEFLAVVGASGSGKSTLLNVIGGLDRDFEGSAVVLGKDLAKLSDRQLSRLRGADVGFVFQSYNLVPPLTVLQNVLLPTFFGASDPTEDRTRARQALARVGLSGKEDRLPARLSGGERQRVALARALFRRPRLVLADEPTGSLDARTGAGVIELLGELSREGITLVVVTHEQRVSRAAHRVVRIAEGRILGGEDETSQVVAT